MGIRVTEPRVLDRVTAILPPNSTLSRTPVVRNLFSLVVGGTDSRSSVKRFNLLYLDAMQLARMLSLDETLQTLAEHLHALVALQSPHRLFIRATVVAWCRRAVVIPNDYPANDDGLLQALLRDGATYYSNRYGVIDGRGFVHPYPARTLRDLTDPLLAAQAIETLPGLPIGLVAFRCADRPDGPRMRELTRAQCVLRLLTHTAVSHIRPRFALAMLTRALDHAVAFEAPTDAIPEYVRKGGRHAPSSAAREPHRSGARPRAARL